MRRRDVSSNNVRLYKVQLRNALTTAAAGAGIAFSATFAPAAGETHPAARRTLSSAQVAQASLPPDRADAPRENAPANGSTRPSVSVPTELRRLFAQLGTDNPAARDAARFELMGLQKSQLEALEALVVESRPLAPAQAAVLHDVVVHVWLAAQPYQATGLGDGFMGVQLGGYSGFGDDAGNAGGAVVSQLFPGFAANRSLLEGDVIVGVRESPIPVTDAQTLISVVGKFRAGDTIHLKVSRAGRIVEVPLTLDPRPAKVGNEFEAFWSKQVERAEAYWDEQFAPLLKPSAS